MMLVGFRFVDSVGWQDHGDDDDVMLHNRHVADPGKGFLRAARAGLSGIALNISRLELCREGTDHILQTLQTRG
jgi:hypothetical protein